MHKRIKAGWILGWMMVVGICVSNGLGADVTVAPNGEGQFKSVQDAIAAAPAGTPDRPWVIHVKPGVYKEQIYIQREKRYLKLEGEDAAKTVITFNLNANLPGIDGRPIGTFRTPTALIDSDDFTAENITFENSAGPVGQALAIRIDGDRATFRNCRFLGWQDTIFANRGRQYFEGCYIAGHVDFIFGAATMFFE
ncbi:MAG TPA: pectinesterase family protein, partial [Blastocatellia bacterium]|nr:pectinesterase family protein [Blastocatellia bacterium]